MKSIKTFGMTELKVKKAKNATLNAKLSTKTTKPIICVNHLTCLGYYFKYLINLCNVLNFLINSGIISIVH